MSIDTILRIVLVVAVVMSAVTGLLSGISSPSKFLRRIVIALVLIWCTLTIGIGVALKPKIGAIIITEGALLAGAPAFALASGLAASRTTGSRRNTLVLILAVAVLLDLGGFYSLNHQVAEIAASIGLTGQPVRKYEPTANKDCPENLNALYLAFELYVESNGSLPKADGWMKDPEFAARIQKDEWFHCPSVSNRHDAYYGYAFNDALSGIQLDGKKLSEMPDAARTPLLYDSSKLEMSAHDSFNSLPSAGRHNGKNNVLYCDGHIEALTPGASSAKR